jgi:cell division protease FtsH
MTGYSLMSDTNSSSPKPPPSDPPRESRPNPRRNDRPQAANVLLWLVVGLGAVVVAYIFMNNEHKGKLLTLGEFETGIEDKTYNPANVFDLKIVPGYIRFQDQPAEKHGSAADESKPVHVVSVPTYMMGSEKEAELTKLFHSKQIDFSYGEPPPDWMNLLPWIPGIAILVVMMYFLRRMIGTGAAMSFGRSRGRLYAQEDIDITFNDAAGIDEAVNELREVVEFLRTPNKYKALGGRIPRGVLLVGPPGTGKTLLAKAVAGEAGVPFFSLSGSDFVEMYVGVGAARVRDMFHQAGSRSPSIIFIDELDALGKVRGSGAPGGHDEREQTLNALLVEMDGFSSDQSVIVMGASNRPETLDPALLRPGRFDRHVLVDRPDIKGREAILKVHAARIKMDDKVELQWIAKLTPGFVGADLANLVNEAALLAARGNKTCVTMAEFEEGIERVVAGLEKQTRIIHEEEKLRVAYHECGHALVACSLPNTDPVHKISIIPRGMGALGYTMSRPEDDRRLFTQTELQNKICVLLGGINAEEIVFQETSTGAQRDLQQASDIARSMVTEFGMSAKLGRVRYSERVRSPFLGTDVPNDSVHSEETIREIDLEVRRIIDACGKTVLDILTNRRAVLEQMSRELLECEVMDASHLRTIIDQHKTVPQLSPGTFVMHKAKPEEAPAPGDEPARREAADGA